MVNSVGSYPESSPFQVEIIEDCILEHPDADNNEKVVKKGVICEVNVSGGKMNNALLPDRYSFYEQNHPGVLLGFLYKPDFDKAENDGTICRK